MQENKFLFKKLFFQISVCTNTSTKPRQNSQPNCAKTTGEELLIGKAPDWCVTVGSGASLIDLV